jgi:plastocyanin
MNHLSSNVAMPSQPKRLPAMSRSRWCLAPIVLVGALLLSACGGSGSPSTTATTKPKPVPNPVITIQNFAFSPGTIVVAPGATVTVTNKDQVVHTLTSLTATWDTGDIQPGQTVTFTAPTKAGRYPYECNIHQFMKGLLIVS